MSHAEKNYNLPWNWVGATADTLKEKRADPMRPLCKSQWWFHIWTVKRREIC